MAQKFDVISELYDRACLEIITDPVKWQSFLQTAGRNFKLRFDEQFLLFIQRPDATAVLEIERWNETFERWVNKGAKGIAVFESADRSRQRLIHYFDISDTHESSHSRPVPIWNMKPEYETTVIEALKNAFGSVYDITSLESVIKESVSNIIKNNTEKYISDFMNVGLGSDIKSLPIEEANSLYLNFVKDSVSYMIMARLGLDVDKIYSPSDFAVLSKFNSQEVFNAVGVATNKTAKIALEQIAKSILMYEQKNRTFDLSENKNYNADVNKNEGRNNYGNNIHAGGRLSSSGLEATGTTGSNAGKMGSDEEKLPEERARNHILQSTDERGSDSALGRSGRESNGIGRELSQADGERPRRDRAAESRRYDEMGRSDEQHQTLGSGNREGTDNLRLEYYDRRHEDKSLPFFGKDDTIREILGTTPHLKASKEEIKDFFELNTDSESRTEYIKSIFNNDYTELTLKDGRTVGYKTFQNVLHLWEGSYNNRTAQSYYDWGVIAQHFEAMRLLGELSDEIKPLPSIDSQLSLIESSQAEEKKPSAFTFSQEVIDAVLTRGSGVSEGKMRIYEQFEKSLSAKENADFLKNEYGWGGSYPVIVGAGIDENHDGKGITLSKVFGENRPSVTLSWSQVEKRIGELIRADRYLNPKEKEQYPQWLEKEEARRAEIEEQKRNREILSTAPPGEAEQPDNDDIIGKEVVIDDRRFIIENVKKISGDVTMRDITFEDTVGIPINRIENIDFVRSLLAEQSIDKTQPFEDEYRLLSRLKSDCEYFLGTGARAEKHLWAGSVDEQIDKMRELYDLLPEKPEWLSKQDIDNYERQMIKSAQSKNNYEYHLGDTVYIGASEYEVLSFDDNRVMLYDPKFPLFNKEMTRAEFDQKVQENPMNDHLKVKVLPAEEITDNTKVRISLDSGNDLVHWIYFNPDANAGGQYVSGDLGFTVFEKLIEQYDIANHPENTDRFVADLEEMSDQFLADINTPFFMEAENDYEMDCDYTEFTPENILKIHKDIQQFEAEHQAELNRMAGQNEPNALPVYDRVREPYRSYLAVKAENPDSLVLYQVGDFYEAYGEDAQKVAEALDLVMTSRAISDSERVPMVGFPQHTLETYMNMLTDRGFDLAVSTVDGSERKVLSIVSTNKEAPVQSKPIGRIDYLHTDGRVRESIEYTSPYQFEKDIKEENYYGVPMKIVLYKDRDGTTISQDFISQLDPQPQGVEIIDSPYLKSSLDIAKEIIDEYCREEFERDEGADYSNLSEVNVAYTTTEDDKHEIQANVNLVDFKIETLVDGTVIRTEQYDSLEDMTERGLKNLSFNDLVYLSDEELERVEKASAPVVPAWEQPKKSKVQSFDLHPEIPMSERHNFDLAKNEITEVNKKERFHRNYAAITVLKRCQEENRFATPDEQKILSRYVGWGGIPEAFDERAGAWHTEYAMLKNILTPEEYDSARESTLTAFYTPPTVIKAVYKAMEQLGFREGNILEPSCGIGHFIGMLPESMSESKIYGVELDTVSAGIAQQLYQKTSIAAQGFEEANLPDSFFDAVVGNVPFGDFKVPDKRYAKHKFLIHDYFFAKSLDKLRPGGVMALITSKGTMDKENPAVRKYIAQRADLLGAIRLPNNTFKGNAGTEVVSDILILQKRDRIVDIEPDWVHLGTDENGIAMNSYFVEHPEMILGEMKMVSGRFGPEPSCVPYEGADLAEQLSEAVANIHGEITAYEVEDELTEEDNSIPADPTVRNFSYTLVDGKIYFRENSRMAPVDVSATAENRIKGMIAIRDCVRHLIELQTEDYPDSTIKEEQAKLNNLYDTFTAKYGLINSRANSSAFSQDSSFSLLSALEVLGDDGTLEKKADMFYKRTIKPHTPVTSVDTSSEALAVSLGEKACIDMEYMCELSGKTEEEIFADLKGVIFLNPMYGYGNSTEAKYLMSDEYLSGNVREKLAWAKKSAQLSPEEYSINVEALQKVQPKDLTASEISVRLGATWLPPEIVEQFVFEFLGTPRYAQWSIKIHFSEYTGEWNIEGKSYDRGNVKAYSTYGTSRINAYKIIEETLNLKDVRIFDYIEDDEGKKKAVLNKKETAIAQAKQELIKQGFQDWIWSDPERRERLCKLYNEKFNSIRPREYDGSHITFNGMNPEIELREHQRNAVAHILYGGNTLLAHAVGAGKTFEMTAAAMESKRLGLCSKSLFVVPNHLTEQWASEFLQLYPSANILVATKKDFETKNRKRFCGRIATGDYDAIIIGHSQFEKIPMSIERQRAILEQQLEEVTNGIADLKRNRGDNFSVKQLERTKKSVKQKLDKLNDQSKKDDVVTFEELGVDRLFIDESHYYKNLFLYTKMRNVGGIAQTEAQKSSDLFMKCRYLDEITGGRGTVFATGTPISNSMVELYTIQRYLQYNTLVKNNLQHFDAWASTFGETVTAVELTPEGTGYRAKTRFARFYNLPELMAMFKEVADIKTADMLDLPVPKAVYHNISVKPSEIQKQMVAELAERAEKVRNGMVDASVDNMLKITNDGRKLALDQRLINPMLPDFEGSKLNACVDAMFETWENGKEKRLTQLFFCDLSTPKNDGNFSVYDDIRKKLIERGVPAEEIKFIHEADTEAKKLELFKKVRKGDVRILMGSTAKMGAGTNVQNKLAASSDLDCPWRPSDLEQRLGRSIRQGNENLEVDIYRFVTEETFDAYLYQLVEGKQKFASQIMTSKSPVRSCEDIDETALSYAEIKMLATGNPYIKEKMDLDIQVQKLRLLKSNFLSEKYALEDKIIKFYPQEIARRTDTIEGLKSDIERAKQHPKPLDDSFIGMTVKGVFYSEKADAGNAILDACQAMTSPDPVPLGEYRGFQIELSFDTFEKEYKVKLKGELGYSVSLGTDTFGNITRLDNALEGLPKRLEINEQELENVKTQFETAKVDVEKPFNQEEELKTKTARLNELNALLNVDKRENEIVGGEPDEGDEEPTPKSKDRER